MTVAARRGQTTPWYRIGPLCRRAARKGLALGGAIAVLAAAGCGRRGEPDSAPRAEEPAPPLRIGILPDLDALPVAAAIEDGAFEASGLSVELVHASSAAERDQLLQAERIDGLVTDLVALCLYNRDGVRVKAVRHSMVPAPGHPQFRIMVAPESTIETPGALADVPVAVSPGTVIEYTVRKALEASGVAPDRIALINVPSIPSRMALLLDGKVAAAGLPEPLASIAESKGARGIVDDLDHSPFSCSVLAFRTEVLDQRPEDIRTFLRVVDEMAATINADPARRRQVALDEKMLPPALAATFRFMPYPIASVPSRQAYDGVAQWLVRTAILDDAAPWNAAVTEAFLSPRQ